MKSNKERRTPILRMFLSVNIYNKTDNLIIIIVTVVVSCKFTNLSQPNNRFGDIVFS